MRPGTWANRRRRWLRPGFEAPGRGEHDAAEHGLGDHEETAGDRVREQGLGVARRARVGQGEARCVGLPGRDPVDRHLVAAGEVVADVAHPDRATRRGRERLDVLDVGGGVRRGPGGVPGAGVDRVEHRAGAGVVHRVDDRPGVDEAAGLRDRAVGEPEQRAVVGPLSRGSPGPAPAARRGRRRRNRRRYASRSRRSSASFGCTPQVRVSSSSSARARSGGVAPVRTARSSVLRGVCWLSTNSMTSTR